jgi:hypothetical protein
MAATQRAGWWSKDCSAAPSLLSIQRYWQPAAPPDAWRGNLNAGVSTYAPVTNVSMCFCGFTGLKICLDFELFSDLNFFPISKFVHIQNLF